MITPEARKIVIAYLLGSYHSQTKEAKLKENPIERLNFSLATNLLDVIRQEEIDEIEEELADIDFLLKAKIGMGRAKERFIKNEYEKEIH